MVGELLTFIVNIVDGKRHMAEVAPAFVVFGVPVVGELKLSLRTLRGSKKDQGKPA